MKIAVTAKETDLQSELDPRFGRARCFLVCDLDSGGVEVVDNAQNLAASQGAGIQAAKTVCDQGVGAVITGNCGPKAFLALQSARIPVYLVAGGTVADAIERFRAGELTPRNEANVSGHWS